MWLVVTFQPLLLFLAQPRSVNQSIDLVSHCDWSGSKKEVASNFIPFSEYSKLYSNMVVYTGVEVPARPWDSFRVTASCMTS